MKRIRNNVQCIGDFLVDMEIIKNLSLSIVTIRTFPVFILEKYDISIQIKINELQGGETK